MIPIRRDVSKGVSWRIEAVSSLIEGVGSALKANDDVVLVACVRSLPGPPWFGGHVPKVKLIYPSWRHSALEEGGENPRSLALSISPNVANGPPRSGFAVEEEQHVGGEPFNFLPSRADKSFSQSHRLRWWLAAFLFLGRLPSDGIDMPINLTNRWRSSSACALSAHRREG